ncbi:MAG: Rieske 2Fe-2S domain-containing protein [Pirellulales bacterium]
MANPVEAWKTDKHGLDVWPDLERYAAQHTPMNKIDTSDLERMKWYGFFYRKRDTPGRYMNRIRITAGELTSQQAKEIAYVAYQLGHGIVDITTRANLQVQGLGIEHLPEVARRLNRVGLTSKQTGHDNIRNVFAHPFSGLLPDELIDTRKLCHEITDLFIDSREFSDLPRKLNICLNGSAQHSAHFWTQDISYLATRNSRGNLRFQVLLAGTQGQNPHLAWHMPVLVAPDRVVEVTRAILDLFRTRGSREKRNAARLCFLVKEIGIDGVMQWLGEYLPFPLEPCVTKPEPAVTHDELIGWFRQRDPNLWTMGISVPLGRMTWRQLEGLAVLSKRWGDGQLRTTHEQGIAVINVAHFHKDAAATDAAALGLSLHADPFEMNTMACTGSQFCNIAVTETKGHMFRLIDNLRKKSLKLHGIRIHMSGCPSSCAQHFTADIGLKGVRVRRLVGTREGFDVFLGGGVAGEVQMGLPYRFGVDVDQLPTLIDQVVSEYYQNHLEGQAFSAYWRDKLRAEQAAKVEETQYRTPTWMCEGCRYEHHAEDPPVFCPSCAGLRRRFVRLDDSDAAGAAVSPAADTTAPEREDGFLFAAMEIDLTESEGRSVEVAGNEMALFRVDGQVHAIDAACPHEGAPLAQGEIKNGTITCPWHGWAFNTCTGCSLDPPGHDVRAYPTLVEDGRIFVKLVATDTASPVCKPAANGSIKRGGTPLARPVEVELRLADVIPEAPGVKTFRFDNGDGQIPHDLPGRFVKLCVPTDGDHLWRSFTISSSPTSRPWLDLTIKRNPGGIVTPYLFEHLKPGATLKMKGPQGNFCFDPEKHSEPLALVSAGSGITPMLSIARYLRDTGIRRPCAFLYGARSAADVLFCTEVQRLADDLPSFHYAVTLSQPEASWLGPRGRIDVPFALEEISDVAARRWFLCGPDDFMDSLRAELIEAGVEPTRIHTEQFHAAQFLAS